MARYSNEEIVSALINGQEDILFYLNRKYFETARRWLRRKGTPDAQTPEIFTTVLVNVYREIQHSRISPNIPFEPYLFNALQEFLREEKMLRKENKFSLSPVFSDQQRDIVAGCVNLMEVDNRRLLAARYAENLSYEQIAVRFEYSNPVIAQFEVNKAMNQLEGIARARLNISSN
ncbi:MAG: sigma-70 family RNA polymerase sigma factor [Bacteroidetes bacterium]|nr:sigma-70 family RNA polymerase sigma factor [Bacteroidota bacterium]MBP6400945.1 sigma-70 family RNA polymerase sigma factor [Bacteroidia bacterium]MBK9524846.1 sigma-70 family RNA polymerase sigma factor [Bacteroidota bacterium]MBK9543012.1 sigma-70 family RNA polymerase sigma factor [Bacteroidota bacterium]MBL0257291.1 sigma-70 family RNA polymerase sigma factor [Bacteroidota bacterium]